MIQDHMVSTSTCSPTIWHQSLEEAISENRQAFWYYQLYRNRMINAVNDRVGGLLVAMYPAANIRKFVLAQRISIEFTSVPIPPQHLIKRIATCPVKPS